MAMLARKPVNWQSQQANMYTGEYGQVQRKEPFLLDMSLELKYVLQIFAICIAFWGVILLLQATTASAGYSLVHMQQEAVQLTKANDQLGLEVAELKSPIRIQEIAQKKLGMVLPDSFMYSSKGTVVEDKVKAVRPIVD